MYAQDFQGTDLSQWACLVRLEREGHSFLLQLVLLPSAGDEPERSLRQVRQVLSYRAKFPAGERYCAQWV